LASNSRSAFTNSARTFMYSAQAVSRVLPPIGRDVVAAFAAALAYKELDHDPEVGKLEKPL
jgi:hypothetical protein